LGDRRGDDSVAERHGETTGDECPDLERELGSLGSLLRATASRLLIVGHYPILAAQQTGNILSACERRVASKGEKKKKNAPHSFEAIVEVGLDFHEVRCIERTSERDDRRLCGEIDVESMAQLAEVLGAFEEHPNSAHPVAVLREIGVREQLFSDSVISLRPA